MKEQNYGGPDPRDEARQKGAEIQQELERQLREFGVSMSDAFQHGFEGRGQEIGDRAWDVGRAVVDAVNFGLSEAGRAMDEARAQRQTGAQPGREGAYDYSAQYASGARENHSMPRWAREIFGEPDQKAGAAIRSGTRKLFGVGLAMAIVGGIFAFGLGVGGVACAATAGMFVGSLTDVVGSVGACLVLAACGFLYMAIAGGRRIGASRRLNQYADVADAAEIRQGVPLELLADLTHQKKKKVRRELRRFIRKGWLTAWLDEDGDRLYLTAEDYRAGRSRPQPVPEAKAPEQPEEAVPLNLETVRRFAAVLEQEKQLMRDPQAAEELGRMHVTTKAICDWLEAHPESLPKARRFAEYYIPTTLKLLHTYNDVQGQQGENAEAIRRDIAGILHTLNLAYGNLYDNLLSDTALDVSSEIAALQGMLANDGLTGEGMV